MAKSRDNRLKAAKKRLAASEAFVKSVKFQATGNLEASHEAIQTAKLATKESLKLRHPWSKREQHEADKILRGGASSDSELSLGEVLCGPSPDEARDRVQQSLGWQKAVIGTMESRSESGRKGAAVGDNAKFNREVENALAEIQLTTKRGERSAAAEKHLKDNHPGLWKGSRREGLRGVESLVTTPWFRERMRQSQKLRAEIPVSKADRLARNRR